VQSGLTLQWECKQHGVKGMSTDLKRKTGLGSAAAAVAVAMTVVAWPLASQAEHGHGGRTGDGAGFSAAPSAGGHTRSGSSHFSGSSGSRSFGFRANDGRHFRHRHNGAAFGFYGDDYGYGYTSSCEYYRQRALDTGRSYWWRRYRACLND
jgi:hypothetical protein